MALLVPFWIVLIILRCVESVAYLKAVVPIQSGRFPHVDLSWVAVANLSEVRVPSLSHKVLFDWLWPLACLIVKRKLIALIRDFLHCDIAMQRNRYYLLVIGGQCLIAIPRDIVECPVDALAKLDHVRVVKRPLTLMAGCGERLWNLIGVDSSR